MRKGSATGGLQNSRADLEERTLAGSIFSQHAKRLAAADFEGDVAESPEVGVEAAAVQQREFLQAVARSFVDGVGLRDVRKLDGESGLWCTGH